MLHPEWWILLKIKMRHFNTINNRGPPQTSRNRKTSIQCRKTPSFPPKPRIHRRLWNNTLGGRTLRRITLWIGPLIPPWGHIRPYSPKSTTSLAQIPKISPHLVPRLITYHTTATGLISLSPPESILGHLIWCTERLKVSNFGLVWSFIMSRVRVGSWVLNCIQRWPSWVSTWLTR